MKVITIRQPWASLIANGYKEYEFRSWQTKYRGPLLIHAGQGLDKECVKNIDLNLEYPKSRVIAKVILEDCILVDDKFNDELAKKNKQVYGLSNKVGLYAWKLSHVEKVSDSQIVKGQLGLWNIDI